MIVPTYRLTRAASGDIERIFIEGFKLFGLAQADKYHDGLTESFEFLAEFPRAARLREEISPPVRAFRYKAHVIIDDLDTANTVIILRVRHGLEDWIPFLRED